MRQPNILPEDPAEHSLALAVQNAMRPSDLVPEWRRKNQARGADPMTGHCFVAVNAFWHMTGAHAGPYVPRQVRVEGASHWFLEDRRTGRVVDLTASQFTVPVPYHLGRGVGMRARPGGDSQPTDRAQVVIDRVLGVDAPVRKTRSTKRNGRRRVRRTISGRARRRRP
jgi:hypothetical protein